MQVDFLRTLVLAVPVLLLLPLVPVVLRIRRERFLSESLQQELADFLARGDKDQALSMLREAGGWYAAQASRLFAHDGWDVPPRAPFMPRVRRIVQVYRWAGALGAFLLAAYCMAQGDRISARIMLICVLCFFLLAGRVAESGREVEVYGGRKLDRLALLKKKGE